MSAETQRVRTLGIFIDANASDDRLRMVCFKHTQRLGAAFGLQIKHFNHEMLKHRLIDIWSHRSDLTAFRISDDTTNWWHLYDRPSLPQDLIINGVYSHVPITTSLLTSNSELHA